MSDAMGLATEVCCAAIAGAAVGVWPNSSADIDGGAASATDPIVVVRLDDEPSEQPASASAPAAQVATMPDQVERRP